MTASVANEMTASKEADDIVRHLESRKGGWDVLLYRISNGAGDEGTGSDNEGYEW